MSSWNLDTLVNHQDAPVLPTGNTPLVAPIYQSVKFTATPAESLPSVLAQGGYVYSRVRNPTVRQLEQLLCQLQLPGQKDTDAIAVASGVAAISSLLLSLLQTGDHVLLFVESYRPSRYLCRSLLKRFGIGSSLLSITDHQAIAEVITTQRPKVMLFESPTNPCLKIADLDFLCGIARQHGVLSVLDNTFAGFHNHGQYPIDFYVHSLTKYGSGHGDVMGGIILGQKEKIAAIHEDIVTLGPTLDPHAAYLILRGLKTYGLRYRQGCKNAERVAAYLEGHKKVVRVMYPGLSSHPQAALCKEQMKEGGTLVAFDLRGSASDVTALMDRLQLFRFAGSLGSTESLIMPCYSLFGGDLSKEEAAIAGLSPTTIRLSIGIEDVDDLIADLDAALSGIAS